MHLPTLRRLTSAVALATTAFTVHASPVVSTNAGTAATAQVLNASSFSLDSVWSVHESTQIAHVEITSQRTSAGFDFYQFTTLGGVTNLDIDATSNVDLELVVWNSAGTRIAFSDDAALDPGSSSDTDPNWFGLTLAADTYVVGICRFNCEYGDGFQMTGNAIPGGASYILNISTNVASDVPEPASLALALLALAGAGAGTQAGRAARRRPA